MISKLDVIHEIKIQELVLIFLGLLVTGIVSSFVVKKQQIFSYFSYIFYRILYRTFQNIFGRGLFAGFMTTSKLGYLYYLFVVPRLVFDNFEDNFFLEHQQNRAGCVASFVIGQLVMFASVYHPRLQQRLVQPDCIFLLFLSFFVLQVFWTYETIIQNWNYLKRNGNRKRVVRRLVLIQVEFMCNFFLQLSLLPSNSYIERDSMVRRLVNAYLKDKGRKLLFVTGSFVGWLIGHILFMTLYVKLFKRIVRITIWIRNWLKKHFLQK